MTDYKQIQMDYQKLYQDEKRNRENILKMQKTIMADNDQYIMGFVRLKNVWNELKGEQPMEEDGELTPAEAGQLVDEVAAFMRKNSRGFECDRWKELYRQESEETLKMSQQKQELLVKLQEKEEQEALDRVEINKLLNDYLELFRRDSQRISAERQTDKKRTEKHARSKSKGKNVGGQAQTDRKPVKTVNVGEVSVVREDHSRGVVERLERDIQALQSELKQLREVAAESEKVLRLYRARERRYLLSGCLEG